MILRMRTAGSSSTAVEYCCRKGLPFITGTSVNFEAKDTDPYASLTFPHFDALSWLHRQPNVQRVAYIHLDSYLLADFLPSRRGVRRSEPS
jgi:hypothetical protein